LQNLFSDASEVFDAPFVSHARRLKSAIRQNEFCVTSTNTIFFIRAVFSLNIVFVKIGALFDLTGETAVVIGATGVLGGVLAEGLAEAGAKVAVLGRNVARGEAKAKAILDQGGARRFFSPRTPRRPPAFSEAQHAIVKSLGAPSILVNAAGWQ
jgi:hypothetical protein